MTMWIGDIGGSSSRWAVVEGDQGEELAGPFPGFNPVVGDPAALQAALRKAAGERGDIRPAAVVAYGAGCGVQARARRVQDMLAGVWPGVPVQVETDLLGAARSLYGPAEGLVLILGTGMNAGHYDGEGLHTPMPSLGYVLGDEGSGADIGRHLLRDALYGLVPEELRPRLFPEGLDLEAVLASTYRSDTYRSDRYRTVSPQAYVASFTARLTDHREEPYVHDLVASRFFALSRLLARFHPPGQRGPMGIGQVKAAGSVAHGFRDLLATALAHHGMQLTGVERDPLPGLIAFHAR